MFDWSFCYSVQRRKSQRLYKPIPQVVSGLLCVSLADTNEIPLVVVPQYRMSAFMLTSRSHWRPPWVWWRAFCMAISLPTNARSRLLLFLNALYTLTLWSVFRITKDAQQQHGLRHGDYQRYRGYCSRRLRRLRKVLKIPQVCTYSLNYENNYVKFVMVHHYF